MNDFERKSIELRKQKGTMEAQIDELKANISVLDSDIVVIEKYAFEIPTRARDTRMKGLNMYGLKGDGKVRTSAVRDSLRETRLNKGKGVVEKEDEENEEEDGEGDGDEDEEEEADGFSDVREVSEEDDEMTELERDPKLPALLFPNLPMKGLSGGPSNRSGRKRLRDEVDEEDEGASESTKKRRTDRYALRNGK